MSNRPRIYLDNAATSWPKPNSVYDAVNDYQSRLGAAVGRGGYAEADEVGRMVEETREAIASLLGAENASRVVFTFNGTDSLNLAIHGVLNHGDHVITTVAEHNSVLRPLRRLENTKLIEVTRIGCDLAGVVDPGEIESAIRPDTKLIIVTHASNVTGTIQPVAQIGRIARENQILFLVDAAQTLGHMPVSVAEIGADLLAAPGHKGLLGPLGTGILYLRPGVEKFVACVRQGGTGSSSSSEQQPDSLPEKYESGNQNASGIIGLGAGVEYIKERGIQNIRDHALQLTRHLLAGLSQVPGVNIIGPGEPDSQTGVVSINFQDRDSPTVAQQLEDQFRIQVRAGFQCAALMHRALDTLRSRGTIRFSVGPLNTQQDISSAVSALTMIANSTRGQVIDTNCPCVLDTAKDDPKAYVAPASRESTNIEELPGLKDLWDETLGDPSVRVAVLDGPVDTSHPAFEDAHLATLGEDHDHGKGAGHASAHGIHVASVIFAQHNGLLRGIAPNCFGLLRQIFFDASNDSLQVSSQDKLAKAIDDAINAGAHVINISGGEPSLNGEAEPCLSRAIQECDERGILVVAAAGNGDCPGRHACDCMHVPAALPTVLAVGAMDRYGNPTTFSNCSSSYAKHGVLAPGDQILGAAPMGTTRESTGTSYAAPVVAGVAALLMSLQKKLGLEVDGCAVREALLKSSDPCNPDQDLECQRILTGRINISRAVSLVKQGSTLMHSEKELLPADCGCEANTEQLTLEQDSDIRENQGKTTPQATSHIRSTTGAIAAQQLPATATGVSPSSCIENSNGQLVYVIGQLSFDFGTSGNRESLQNNIPTPRSIPFDNPLQITDPFGLLAYLLGCRYKVRNHRYQEGTKKNPEPCGPKWYEGEVCGNINDASFINWVLLQHNCPKYVLKPQGAYEEAGHMELIRFLIEQNGYLPYLHMPDCDTCPDENYPEDDCGDYPDLREDPPRNWYTGYGDFLFQLRGDCLQHYYRCHGGVDCCPCVSPESEQPQGTHGTEEVRQSSEDEEQQRVEQQPEQYAGGQATFATTVELAGSYGLQLSSAEFIAIGGEICGVKRLISGAMLPVISPAMRSSASWNVLELIRCVGDVCPVGSHEAQMFLLALVQTLSEHVHNDGITPEERATNYAATSILSTLPALLAPHSSFYSIVSDFDPVTGARRLYIGFDGTTVEPAKCRDVDTLPYDVTLIFYNTNSLRPSRVFVTQAVNVADVNPVAQLPRISVRR